MASNKATNKLCALCPPDKARPANHSHHLREVAYGGPKDGLQVGLCANCHTELHDLARDVLAGTIAFEAVTKPRWKKALWLLLDQRRIFADAKKRGVLLENERASFSIPMDRTEQAQLREMATRTGTSQKDFLKALIQQAYRRMKSGQPL